MTSRATGAVFGATPTVSVSPTNSTSFTNAYVHVPIDGASLRPHANVGFEVVEHRASTSSRSSAPAELAPSSAKSVESVVSWFPLQLAQLRPLHQYNLELISSGSGGQRNTDANTPSAVRLYVCVRVSPRSLIQLPSPHDVLQIAIAEATDTSGGGAEAIGCDVTPSSASVPLSGLCAAGVLVADHEAHSKNFYHTVPHQTCVAAFGWYLGQGLFKIRPSKCE